MIGCNDQSITLTSGGVVNMFRRVFECKPTVDSTRLTTGIVWIVYAEVLWDRLIEYIMGYGFG